MSQINELDCEYCADYRSHFGCVKVFCPWLRERLASEAISYRDAIAEALNKEGHLGSRLERLAVTFSGMWKDEAHLLRMKTAREMMSTAAEIDDPPLNAALYLLSSSFDLFSRMVDCFRGDGLQLDRACIHNISFRDRTLYLAAWHIYNGEREALADRAVKYVTSDNDLALIINALIITRFGPAAFELRGVNK